MSAYPRVADEHETIKQVLAGKSLARLGDGELKVMSGQGYARETPKKALSQELQVLVNAPNKNCLIGIPTLDKRSSKYHNWLRHQARFEKYLRGKNYYSAFVTRPDCAPWIDNLDYVEQVQRIWQGRRVAVVSEPQSKLLTAVRLTEDPTYVSCPSYEAYRAIDALTKNVLATRCEVVVISCGVTATCLANRLSDHVQAVDLGSIGGFLMRWLEMGHGN